MFANLKVGDTVFVVFHNRRACDATESLPVARVGRKYGYIMYHRREVGFDLKTGICVDKDRVSFTVHPDEAEYRERERRVNEANRLWTRMRGSWGFKTLPFTCVDKIHAVLDEEGLP